MKAQLQAGFLDGCPSRLKSDFLSMMNHTG